MFLIKQPEVSTAAERYLLVYMIVVLVVISALIITFFIVFVKRKDKLLMDKLKQQKAFEEEISLTQLEIQEQTLKDIGRELHDNVGQLLSVASMQMSILNMQIKDAEIKTPFSETKNIIKDSLSEIRALSKSLNSDVIITKGFKQSVDNEVKRLNKLNGVKAELHIAGDSNLFIESKDTIILFRILQEFISNTVKYAEATLLKINLDYTSDMLSITISDDGKGFDIDGVEHGNGLLNIRKRAELINATHKLTSTPGEGVTLNIDYNYKQLTHTPSK